MSLTKNIIKDDIYMLRKYGARALTWWRDNPVSFLYECMGESCLPYQADILNSVRDNKRTIVKSGHGVGKSHIMARAAWWWMITHKTWGEECVVVCTAPTASQVEKIFWARLSAGMQSLPDYLNNVFTMTTETLYCTEDPHSWHLVAKTAKRENSDALAGFHNCLYLIDEWSGVPNEIAETIQGAMSDRGSKILAIGNPLRRKGWGYNAFTKSRKLWKTFTINCEDWTDERKFPTFWWDMVQNMHVDWNYGRCDPKEFNTWIAQYGIESNEYNIRVLGEFPDSDKNQLIKTSWIERCFSRPTHEEEKDKFLQVVAVDIARQGSDDSALVHRNGANIIEAKTWHSNDLTESAGEVMHYVEHDCKQQIDYLIIDCIGIGQGVYDFVRLHKPQNVRTLYPYMSSGKSPSEKLDKLRDYSWWRMREWFRDSEPSFLLIEEDHRERLRSEIASIGYNILSV